MKRFLQIVLPLFTGFGLIVSVTAVQMNQLDLPQVYEKLELTRNLHRHFKTWNQDKKRPKPVWHKYMSASLHDHRTKIAPDACQCPGNSNSIAGKWNHCLSCLYVTFHSVYNDFAAKFGQYIDSDQDLNTMVKVGGTDLRVLAKPSALPEYDRYALISKTSGEVCLSLHYSKITKQPERRKGILHLNSENCPNDGTFGSHAIVMKFDHRYSAMDVQRAFVFQTGEYEGNGFDVKGLDGDDIFYMDLKIENGPNEKQKTTAWAYRLSGGDVLSYFVNGYDDSLLYVASADSKISNLSEQATLQSQCVNDKEDTPLPETQCLKAGFQFRNFPISVDKIATRSYPQWTVYNLDVLASRAVQDYFSATKK